MGAQKRSKISTTTNSVHTMHAARQKHEPVQELDADELRYFEMITQAREFDTWTNHDLSIAGNLARLQHQFDGAAEAVRINGRTVANIRGTVVANAEVNVLLQLSGAIRAASAQLGLSASQKGLSTASQKGRNAAEQTARKVINKASVDGLLAGFDD